jgi:hypothetical protein
VRAPRPAERNESRRIFGDRPASPSARASRNRGQSCSNATRVESVARHLAGFRFKAKSGCPNEAPRRH